MLDASQLADRFLIMPGRKTLSYQERQGPTWGTAFTVYDAERKNPTAKDLADGQSFLSANDTIFYVWKSRMGSVEPKPGDKFSVSDSLAPDNGEAFTVRLVSTFLLGQRYQLVCGKQK